jgi:MFS family permease
LTDPASPAHDSTTTSEEPYERRWLALAVIAVTVLMVILDATIVNIALPAVSVDIGITAAAQQWIVTAYTLTFGGFLLLGGRIADFWGRKREDMPEELAVHAG